MTRGIAADRRATCRPRYPGPGTASTRRRGSRWPLGRAAVPLATLTRCGVLVRLRRSCVPRIAMTSLNEWLLFRIVPFAGYLYVRLLGATMRLEFRNREVLHDVRRADGQYILAFWHARFVMMPFAYDGPKLVVLASEHRDSRLLANMLGRFGLVSAWGSSSSRGAVGMRQILRRVREGFDVGLTPDGPRGPRRRAKPGVIAIARLSGLPIIPVTVAARPARRLRSWDRTVLPWPFGRGIVVFGEPLRIPRDGGPDADEGWRQRLESELDRLTDEADRCLGLEPESPVGEVPR